MNTKHVLLLILITILSLFACSEKEAEKPAKPAAEQAASATADQASGNTMPSGHPSMDSPEMQQRMQQGMQRIEKMNKSGGTPQVIGAGQGTVLKVMHSAGYTYMEVDLGDKKTWVAATTLKIKSGDKVKWQGASIMKNFSSKSLHRTFEEILFVSHASKG